MCKTFKDEYPNINNYVKISGKCQLSEITVQILFSHNLFFSM